MIKKILLLTIAAVSFAACSKSDKDAPVDNGNGSNDKLLGSWVGTYDIIAEKPEQQVRLVELFKREKKL